MYICLVRENANADNYRCLLNLIGLIKRIYTRDNCKEEVTDH